MESTYRTWLRARREWLVHQHLDELGRDLQRALGTAKWQLEEFEKAVHLSYRKHGDDITITRHRQFISALEDQISHVELALKEAINQGEMIPLRWVNLDEEECDSLALFLSGTPGTSRSIKNESENNEVVLSSPYSNKKYLKESCSLGFETSPKSHVPSRGKNLEVVTNNETASELEGRKISETGGKFMCQADRITSSLRTWSLLDKNALEIIIDCDDKQKNPPMETTLEENWGSRCKESSEAKGVLSHTQLKIIHWMKQHLKRDHRSHRQQQVLPISRVNSLRFMLVTVLTIVLVCTVFLGLF